MVIRVKKLLRKLRKRLFQIVPVDRLNGGILMGEADRSIRILPVEYRCPVPREFLLLVNRLSASSDAAPPGQAMTSTKS